MQINPTHAAFGAIFDGRSIFEVPRYQRGYAWGDEAISDFLEDVNGCYLARAMGAQEREHFFGGVLSIRRQMQGVANESKFELVDGQQRVTTLTLLASAIYGAYQDIYQGLGVGGDAYRERVELRKGKLKNSFIEYPQAVNKEIRRVNVLTLSRNDEPFYRALLVGGATHPTRDSHRKLKKAFQNIEVYVRNLVNSMQSVEDKLDVLENLENILLTDFSVLHMVVDSRSDAYRLFQVINDRGVSLTDGDLLRARVLEILEGHDAEQQEVEALWDDILRDDPGVTLNYLNWIYESYGYSRAKASSFADAFFSLFFSPDFQANYNYSSQVEAVLGAMRLISHEIGQCRKIVHGEWPYPEQQPVTAWERSRLKILTVDLGHTLAVPLLLALCKLDHVAFRDSVLMLERAFFRYKIICGEHVTPLKTLYNNAARAIRQSAQYNIQVLRGELNAILEEKSPVSNFKDGIRALKYQQRDGGNKPIKYFLASIESYSSWFNAGAVGSPQCIEGNRIYDFASTSIEHIYPKNARAGDRVAALEPEKNSIRNLTLLDPVPNTASGNDPFLSKKPMYAASSLWINREISGYNSWGVAEMEDYEQKLLEMAATIFVA